MEAGAEQSEKRQPQRPGAVAGTPMTTSDLGEFSNDARPVHVEKEAGGASPTVATVAANDDEVVPVELPKAIAPPPPPAPVAVADEAAVPAAASASAVEGASAADQGTEPQQQPQSVAAAAPVGEDAADAVPVKKVAMDVVKKQ